MEKKNKGGRPPKWKTAEELNKDLDAYIQYIEEKDKPFLILGFTLFCDCNRHILDEYDKKEEFSSTVKKIHALAEASLVEGAMTGKYNPTFSIFLAKNNHGYRDKVEQEVSGTTVQRVIKVNPTKGK